MIIDRTIFKESKKLWKSGEVKSLRELGEVFGYSSSTAHRIIYSPTLAHYRMIVVKNKGFVGPIVKKKITRRNPDNFRFVKPTITVAQPKEITQAELLITVSELSVLNSQAITDVIGSQQRSLKKLIMTFYVVLTALAVVVTGLVTGNL